MLEPLEILLVDDNDDDVLMVQRAFEESKIANDLHRARDGVEALSYLRREGRHADAQRPGLVLLDIGMPRKNGFEVLEEMKNDPELRSIPVVVLTTSDREEDVVRAYGFGACSYIQKPVNFERFVSVIRDFSVYWTLVARTPARGG